MELKHLTDIQLVKDTKHLIRQELKCIAVILTYLAEIEERKLFSELKYPSMLDFVVVELGYSTPAANRRIQSARLMKEFPEIKGKIISGSLTLTNLHKTATYFRKEKVTDSSMRKCVLEKIENVKSQDCEKILFELTSKPLPSESIRPVSENHMQLKINITDQTHRKLDKLKAFMGFHLIDNDYFSAVADEAYQNVERKRFKLAVKGRETHSLTRNPSNYDRRKSYESSEKVCENCGGFFLLQDDHREPYALGGSSDASNLRLLCFHCNQRARINAKL